MIDRFSGDPRLVLTPDGATLEYQAGQPVMDQGIENCMLLSLLADERWVGNVFLPPEQRIGSDYERAALGPITLTRLRDIENAAERALRSKVFGTVSAQASNPVADHVSVTIHVGSGAALGLSRQKSQWAAQVQNPASRRIQQ